MYRIGIIVVVMMVVAACGGQPAAEAPATGVAVESAAPAVAPTEASVPTTEAAATPDASPTEAATTEAAATTGATTEADAAVTTSTAPEGTTAASTDIAPDGTFPVTIQHKFGSVTIPAAPQRVISLGYNDQDPILALGVVPIAVREWFGEQPGAVWPWAQDLLGGTTPEVLNMPYGELNFEAIAALNPDLIIGVSAGITDAEYATLSQIAPTLAQSNNFIDFGVTWQEQTRVIGQALGKATLAGQLVRDMEARFAEVAAAHPEFAGKTATVDSPAGDGQFFFSGPTHERMRVLTTLGFVLPDELATIAGASFYGTVSGEELPRLDTDIMVWTVTAEQRVELEKNAIYQQLRATREGRNVFLDTSDTSDLAGPALVYSSVLSLPIVFDQLLPRLTAAVDGDPATMAPSGNTEPAATTEADATTAPAATTATPE